MSRQPRNAAASAARKAALLAEMHVLLDRVPPSGLANWEENEQNPESDRVKITVVEVDADVDSDNGGDLTDLEEDAIEAHDDKPGKFVGVNDDDDDGDGIPDYADGFDLDPDNPDDDDGTVGEDFVELQLTLSDAVNLDQVTLTIDYQGSNPDTDPPARSWSMRCMKQRHGGRGAFRGSTWPRGLQPYSMW